MNLTVYKTYIIIIHSPFNFLDGFENRTAYAMAFGTATSTVVSLIKSEHTLEFDLPLWATGKFRLKCQ